MNKSQARAHQRRFDKMQNEAVNSIALLEKLSHWIVRERKDIHKDHACAECAPNGGMIVDGFKCAYHEAMNILDDNSNRGIDGKSPDTQPNTE